MSDQAADRVTLDLDANEALVLFEFLYRHNESSSFDALIVDQAEQRVLWDVLASLEQPLFLAIAAPDYDDRVAAARDAVRDSNFPESK